MSGTSPPSGRTRASLPPRRRWTCPVCGESRLKLVCHGKNERHIANDLQSHVRSTGGGGHGRPGSIPDQIDVGALRAHVDHVDG